MKNRIGPGHPEYEELTKIMKEAEEAKSKGYRTRTLPDARGDVWEVVVPTIIAGTIMQLFGTDPQTKFIPLRMLRSASRG